MVGRPPPQTRGLLDSHLLVWWPGSDGGSTFGVHLPGDVSGAPSRLCPQQRDEWSPLTGGDGWWQGVVRLVPAHQPLWPAGLPVLESLGRVGGIHTPMALLGHALVLPGWVVVWQCGEDPRSLGPSRLQPSTGKAGVLP